MNIEGFLSVRFKTEISKPTAHTESAASDAEYLVKADLYAMHLYG